MGKVLIIRGADFSKNAIETIDIDTFIEVNLESLSIRHYTINNSANAWKNTGYSVLVPVVSGDIIKVTNNSGLNTGVAFLTTDNIVLDQTPSYSDGVSAQTIIVSGNSIIINTPTDALYLYVKLGDTQEYLSEPDVYKSTI